LPSDIPGAIEEGWDGGAMDAEWQFALGFHRARDIEPDCTIGAPDHITQEASETLPSYQLE